MYAKLALLLYYKESQEIDINFKITNVNLFSSEVDNVDLLEIIIDIKSETLHIELLPLPLPLCTLQT